MHTGRSVEREIRVAAPPDKVWAVWTRPEALAGWFVDRAEGVAEAGATVTWFFDAFGYAFPVEVLEADPPARLVLRESVPTHPPRHTEIVLAPDGDGTRLRFVQSGFREDPALDEEFAGCERGWTLALATMRLYAERYFGKPRRNLLVMRPAVFEYDDLVPWFTSGPGLKAWFTTAGAIGEEDEPYELDLWEGSRMSGTVLARARPEVLVSWDEVDGAFTFKAFKMGPTQRMVALQVTAWGMNEGRAAEISAWSEASIDRLMPQLQR